MSDLLPCPFCGGENVKVFGPVGWNREYGVSHSCRFFYNGAQEMAQGFRSAADAIAAWNRRALPSASSEDVRAEALKEALKAVLAKRSACDTSDELRGLALAEDAILRALESDARAQEGGGV